MRHAELLINGTFFGGPCDQSIGKGVSKSPWDGTTVGTWAEAGPAEIEAALDAATEAFRNWRHSTRRDRQTLLRRVGTLVREREQELVELAILEIGKPVEWAKGEVMRLAITFELAADFLSGDGEETVPVDIDPRGRGYRCSVERFPIGPILAIAPYNWPYNLVAHKLAPALAAGNTVVLKASGAAALCTLTLARLIHEAGCPAGVVNAVACDNRLAEKMVVDPRIKMLSFTGSPGVGWRLKGLIPEKKVALELGGNAFAVVAEDADLDWAIPRIVAGGYGYAGQVCIAIQHVLVHAAVYEEVRERLAAAVAACPAGDPSEPGIVCGPLISAEAADRVMEWVADAERLGATRLTGGERERNLVRPILLEGAPTGAQISCQEVFGPVITLERYATADEAIERINGGEYGIQTGVFTRDAALGERFFRELDVGGVIVGDFPTLRFDAMPYGGVKRSGFGREGIRWAFGEMTEPKFKLERLI